MIIIYTALQALLFKTTRVGFQNSTKKLAIYITTSIALKSRIEFSKYIAQVTRILVGIDSILL